MQRLILAVTFAVTIGAIMMSGPLGAGHQIPTKTSLPAAQPDRAF